MRKKLIVVACLLFPFIFLSPSFANECANTVIEKTKMNLGSATAFRDRVCKPHLTLLARHPVRKKWGEMSPTEQEQQLRYACGVFHSVASKLAKFDSKKIKWVGDVGRHNGVVIKVGFTGNCQATSACVGGYPCLENLIKDFRKVQ